MSTAISLVVPLKRFEAVVQDARKRYLKSLRRLQVPYGNTSADAVVDLDEGFSDVGTKKTKDSYQAVS